MKDECDLIQGGSGDINRLYSLSESHYSLANELVYQIEEDVAYESITFLGYYAIVIIISICFVVANDRQNLIRIEKTRMHDPLTGALSAYGFEKKFIDLMDAVNRDNYMVVKFDIINFRMINQKLGYDQADSILSSIVINSKKVFKKMMLIARTEADNFYMLVPTDGYFYEHLNDVLSEVMQESSLLCAMNNIRFTCGIYEVSQTDENMKKCIDYASTAHRIARETQQSYVLYDQNLLHKIERQNYFIEALPAALKNKEFKLYLQPQIDLNKKRVSSAESLVRWQLPDGSLVFPDEFIPLFERTDRIVDLDFYMLHRVCEYVQTQQEKGQPLRSIAVNFSRLSLYKEFFYERFSSIIDSYGIPKEYIGIEVLENSVGDKDSPLLEVLKRLKGSGYYVLMDDFGTGHSSLGFISQVSVHTLKLDRNFLIQYDRNESVKEIFHCIITLAHNLSMKVICEGVETIDHVDMLTNLHCDIAQGYYFSKPVPCEEFEAVVKKIEQK